MEMELKNIEERLGKDDNIIYHTLGTKLDLKNAKLIVKYSSWKKL